LNRLTTKQLIYINESLAKLIGLESGVADPELLEYIANAPYELEKGNDFYVYKNVVDKATRTIILFSENKPFKRLNLKTGVIAAIALLELNGINLCFEQNELETFLTSLSCDKWLFEVCRSWLLHHIDKKRSYLLPYDPTR